MFTLLNRKELYITYHPEDYFRIKDILHAAGIPHYTKFGGNRHAASSRRRSAYSSGGNYATQYRIFVKKQDYEAAAKIIHR